MTLVCALIAIPLALLLDKKLHQKHPGAMPYKWGYYTGLMGMLTYGLLALMLLAYSIFEGQEAYAVSIGFLLATIPYFFILKRKRWAWVVGIILLFNPILWIVNAVYARNRWKEMPVPPSDPGEFAFDEAAEEEIEPPNRPGEH
jgi:amino acid permease